jgi:hypothetical protein
MTDAKDIVFCVLLADSWGFFGLLLEMEILLLQNFSGVQGGESCYQCRMLLQLVDRGVQQHNR